MVHSVDDGQDVGLGAHEVGLAVGPHLVEAVGVVGGDRLEDLVALGVVVDELAADVDLVGLEVEVAERLPDDVPRRALAALAASLVHQVKNGLVVAVGGDGDGLHCTVVGLVVLDGLRLQSAEQRGLGGWLGCGHVGLRSKF